MCVTDKDTLYRADIIVSELLGSFGDNELSPECLYDAEDLFKPDAISIPSSYTSWIGPLQVLHTTKLYFLNMIVAPESLSLSLETTEFILIEHEIWGNLAWEINFFGRFS